MMSTQPAESNQPQWQQPDFAEPEPTGPGAQETPPYVPGIPLQPRPLPQGPMVQFTVPIVPPAPPSSLETVLTVVSRALWPVWAVLTFLGPLDFMPSLWIVLVASIVLHAVRRTLRQNRRPVNPASASLPPTGADDLR